MRLALHPSSARFGGQFDLFIPEPDVHLPRTLELRELGEDELDGFLHTLVWILLDAIAADFHVARGDAQHQRAAARFLLQRFLRPLAEQG